MSVHELVGVDGRDRDLDAGPVRTVESGMAGLLNMPASEVAQSTSATRPGSRPTSIRYLPRQGELTVALNVLSGHRSLLEVERDWWAAWSAERPARLRIRTQDEPSRYLEVYLRGDQVDHRFDPDHLGRYVATLNVTAHDPFWKSEAKPVTFEQNEPVEDFFGRDEIHQQDGGPPYWLSASNVARVRRAPNLGDLPAPTRWTLTGPFEEFETTVDGRTIGGRITVPEGHVLTIDAARKRARLWNGFEEVSVWRDLSSWQFGYLPPGKDAEVSVRIEGTGSAVLNYTQQHLRARA